MKNYIKELRSFFNSLNIGDYKSQKMIITLTNIQN